MFQKIHHKEKLIGKGAKDLENSIVDKILRAEKRAADIENMSQRRAEERLLGAKAQGELIIKNAQNKGEIVLKERINHTKIKIQELESQSTQNTNLEIKEISQEAVKRFPEAIKRVKELLIY